MEQNEHIRCLIIGSGPAGYTAAIYAARANLSPVLYEGMQPGGQLTTTSEVENFPGYPDGRSGLDMMEDLKKQAARFGTDIRRGIATAADFSTRPYRITIEGEKVVEADTVIISTGASAKYLGLPDEAKYAGLGVSACATCDGFFYRKKIVAVVGGGDTACEEAEYLSHLASKVYLIVRKTFLRASNIMQQRVIENPNIEILFETQAEGLFGENGVEGVHLVKGKDTDHEEQLPTPTRRLPTCPVYLPPATWPIPATARPSRLPPRGARPLSMPNDTSSTTSYKKQFLTEQLKRRKI